METILTSYYIPIWTETFYRRSSDMRKVNHRERELLLQTDLYHGSHRISKNAPPNCVLPRILWKNTCGDHISLLKSVSC